MPAYIRRPYAFAVTAILILAGFMAGACESTRPVASTTPFRASASPTATAEMHGDDLPAAVPNVVAPSTSKSQPPSPMPPPPPLPTSVTCPAQVTSVSGRYSFQCPAGWHYLNCEGTDFYAPHTMLVNPDPMCSQEEYQVRAFVISFPGSADPPRYLGVQQSTQVITVDGVSGTRAVYKVTANNPLLPPQGTVQVLYKFVSGGRTYYLEYDHFPGNLDRTAAFDSVVTTTLKFSS